MSLQGVSRFAHIFDQIIRNDRRYLMSQELLHPQINTWHSRADKWQNQLLILGVERKMEKWLIWSHLLPSQTRFRVSKGGAMHCRNGYNSYPADMASNNIKAHLGWVDCLQLHPNPIKLYLKSAFGLHESSYV